MRNVAVVGVGVTKFGKHERTCAELFAEAAVDALADADVTPARIQGIYFGNVVGEASERQLHMGPQIASAQAGDAMCLHDKRDLSRALATERAARSAYGQAGLGPEDVDVVELHDCFTIAEIVATEGLGLVEPGAGGLAAEKGETSLGGRIPVNPSGGLKAKGHPIGATGAAQIAEITAQLRGEAGPRQVGGARVGLAHTLGGNTATVLVSLFGR